MNSLEKYLIKGARISSHSSRKKEWTWCRLMTILNIEMSRLLYWKTRWLPSISKTWLVWKNTANNHRYFNWLEMSARSHLAIFKTGLRFSIKGKQKKINSSYKQLRTTFNIFLEIGVISCYLLRNLLVKAKWLMVNVSRASKLPNITLSISQCSKEVFDWWWSFFFINWSVKKIS